MKANNDVPEPALPPIPKITPEERREMVLKNAGPGAVATRIEVHFEDGSIRTAEGMDAFQIWSWLNACEAMVLMRGGKYDGPVLKIDGAN